jgi:hypothetical protein
MRALRRRVAQPLLFNCEGYCLPVSIVGLLHCNLAKDLSVQPTAFEPGSHFHLRLLAARSPMMRAIVSFLSGIGSS